MIQKFLKLILIGIIASFAISNAVAQGNWEGKEPAPTARRAPSAAEVDGKIYVIGGCHGPMANEEYNPATNTWTTKASLPQPRRRGMGSCAAEVNGLVYFFGGHQGPSPGQTVDFNDEYNPNTNIWATKTSIPTAREGAAAATVGGKIYVIGGNEGANFYDIVEEYDPATDSWTTKSPMLTARAFIAAAVFEEKIYVFGGFDGTNLLDTVEEYDPAADSWTTKTSMPTARSWLAAAQACGRIYVMGGNDMANCLDANEEYDPTTDTWETDTPMPTARSHIAAVESGGKIYALCGFWGTTFFDTNEEFTPEPSGVEEEPWLVLPSVFSLEQNYPNPFNAATVISYKLAHPAVVNLNIFNNLGQLVKIMPLGFQGVGNHTCVWNGATSDGTAAPSGVYFYSLKVDRRDVAAQRMILMR